MTAIAEVKQRVNIVDVVSDYISLQKAGRNFKALCPFHTEKTPSFFVFPEKQTWYCFGACGKGGDVFSFVMLKEGLDFRQALLLLAQKAGVNLVSKLPDQAQREEWSRIYEVNEAAAEYYHHLLLKTPTGEGAKEYLNQRGLFLQSIIDFQLGFSPATWEALYQYLLGKNYTEKELIAAGLTLERESKGIYDRFRNRLMFPIRNLQGRVIAFGARALDDSLPKYLNSPQTAIFDKGSSLYGIDRARLAILQQNQVIIVEGYFDVILAHQYGFKNVVASMGTSLTEKQLAVLRRLTKNLVLALDADAAGEEATWRGRETVALTLDKKVMPIPDWRGRINYESVLDAELKVIILPQGKDPDDIIKQDVASWSNLLEKAMPVMDYAFETVVGKVDLSRMKDKSWALTKLLPLISEIKDPLRKSHYVQKLSRLVNVEERILISNLKRQESGKGREEKDARLGLFRLSGSLLGNPLEEYCLALLLQYPELRNEIQEISSNLFESSENRELFLKWQQFSDIDSLRKNLDNSLREHLEHLCAKIFPPLIQNNREERQKALKDCVLRLQEKQLRDLEMKKGELLLLESTPGEVAAQLAKLEEKGIETVKKLGEIFIKRREKS